MIFFLTFFLYLFIQLYWISFTLTKHNSELPKKKKKNPKRKKKKKQKKTKKTTTKKKKKPKSVDANGTRSPMRGTTPGTTQNKMSSTYDCSPVLFAVSNCQWID